MKILYKLLVWLFSKKNCCCKNQMQGKDLVFISHIRRKGDGVNSVKTSEWMNEEWFTVHCLSITEGTWIAHGFNSYVVKLKNKNK